MTVAYICGCGEPVHYERRHACGALSERETPNGWKRARRGSRSESAPKVGVEVQRTREDAASQGESPQSPPLDPASTPSDPDDWTMDPDPPSEPHTEEPSECICYPNMCPMGCEPACPVCNR